MTFAFYIAAVVMIAMAMALLLIPLLRHGRRAGQPRGLFALMLFIALVIPLASTGLYRLLGTPSTIDHGPAPAPPALDIGNALQALRMHLAANPKDAQGWLLLAQAETEMQQPDQARNAYDHVLQLSPDDGNAMIGWVQADAAARTDHRIDGRARELLLRALKNDPGNQRGLWLLGISDFQLGQYADAASTWRLLQPHLTPGSSVAQTVAQQIALADARARGEPDSAASTGDAAVSADAQGPALQVTVSLAPALKAKLAAGDTLFVYARAASGPAMPLAVARLNADKLPATVTLTNAMSMMPAMNLSSAAKVFVGARISHSGQAIAQRGDLEGSAGVVAVNSEAPISIVIDKAHD